MATPDIKPYNTYFGNGSTTEFSVSFPYTKQEYVKLYLKRIGATEVVVDPKDYDFVSKDTIRFPSLSSQEQVLGNGEIITIQRETVAESEFDFSNQKRLFPDDVMDADDLEMQILQEHERQIKRSITVSPTSQVGPEEFLGHVEAIYFSVDNINKVANDIQNINSIALNEENINTVVDNIGSVRSVALSIGSVAIAAASIDSIESVADNSLNINLVAANEPNINEVASNKTNIDKVANNQSNINIVSTDIDSVNNCSTNMPAIKDAPNQAASAANSAKLSAQYANDKINQTHITNCITEIPQDIKLELNNGTLTLKAGSKVCVPNGFEADGITPKFDIITITNDITNIHTSTNEKLFLFVKKDGSGADILSVANCESGANPTPTTFSVKYDTTSNLCKLYTTNLTVQDRNVSFPIAICQGSSSGFTSIDQIFNGFGYIGSTVFALPGVKGLIPNGRNADGSLKNIERTLTTVITRNMAGTLVCFLGTNLLSGFDYVPLSQYNESNTTVPSGVRRWYNPDTNYLYWIESGVIRNGNVLYVGNISLDNGRITSFQPKTTFHAVDYFDAVKYSDKSEVVGWSKPALSRAVTKSSLVTGSAYTSGVTGIVVVSILNQNLARDDYLDVHNATTGERFVVLMGEWADAYDTLAITVRVWKGDVYYINYAHNRTLTIKEIPFGGV